MRQPKFKMGQEVKVKFNMKCKENPNISSVLERCGIVCSVGYNPQVKNPDYRYGLSVDGIEVVRAEADIKGRNDHV